MNNAGAGRTDEAQGISYRDYQLAYTQRVRIARHGSKQAGSFDTQNRQIATSVSTQDLARQAASIPKLHVDDARSAGAFHNMRVGHDCAIGRPDHTRPATPYLYRGAAEFFDDISESGTHVVISCG
jgi:DNA-directed RNA polymerase beta subunit